MHTVTKPASTFSFPVASDGVKRLPPSSEDMWFNTRDGRRYGWEIGCIIVVKVALLVVLWFVFIRPWQRPAMAPATTVQQLYLPSEQTFRHD